jgi:DNA-binding NarL/FixJ family response regulator
VLWNGLLANIRVQNPKVKPPSATLDHSPETPASGHAVTTVLVAVESAQVREALAAMLGALDGFRVVAEADTDQTAIEAARTQRPHLALVEPELSGCGGWWVIQQIRAEHLASVVVALGRRADGILAQMVGAQSYVQMGTSPRDLLSALEAAIAMRVPAGSAAQTEHNLLSDAHAVL